MKVFVLNLERHTGRRQAIESQLKMREIDFEVLAAVDGRCLSEESLAVVYDSQKAQEFLGRQLTRGEVGCAMSHCMAFRRVVSDNLPAALILEDDAYISPMVTGVIKALDDILNIDDLDICLLTYAAKYSEWHAKSLPGTKSRLVPAVDAFQGGGYVVTNRGARRLLEYFTTIHHPFDYWNTFRRKNVVCVKAVVPYVIGQSDLGAVSELDEERRRISADVAFGYVEGMKRFVRRVLYEKFIYQLYKPMLRIRRQPKGVLEKQFPESQTVKNLSV
jgi:glycosyl transferase family 25